MGWLRRNTTAPGPDRASSPSGGEGAAGGPAAPAVAPATLPVTRDAVPAWSTAPVPVLTVQRQHAVLDGPHFGDALTTWRSPARLAPLGHHVTEDAPTGVLTDLPTSLAAPTVLEPSGPATDATVVAHPTAPTATAGPTTRPPTTVPTVQRAADGPIAAPPSTEAPTADLPTAPTLDPMPTAAVRVAAPAPLVPTVPADVVTLPVVAAAPVVQRHAANDAGWSEPGATAEVDTALGQPDAGPEPESSAAPLEVPTLAGPEPDGAGPDDDAAIDRGPGLTDLLGPTSMPVASTDATGPASSPVSSPAPSVQRAADPSAPATASPAAIADGRHAAGLGLPLAGRPSAPAEAAPAAAAEVPPSPPVDTADLLGGAPSLQRAAASSDGPTGQTPTPISPTPTDPSVPVPASPGWASAAPTGLGLPTTRSVPWATPSPDAGGPTVLPPLPPSPVGPPVPEPALAPADPLPVAYAPPEPVAVSRLADTEPVDLEAGSGAPDEPAVADLIGSTALVSVDPWTDTADAQVDAETHPLPPPAVEAPVAPLRPVAPAALPPVISAVQRQHASQPTTVSAAVSPTPTPSPSPSASAPSAGWPSTPSVQRLTPIGVAGIPSSSGGPAPSTGGSAVADLAVAHGLGAVAADGAVVFAPPADEIDSSPSVQRAVDVPPTTEVPAAAEVPSGETSTSAAIAAGPAHPSAGGDGPSHEDLDELATRLYGRIRVQLRRELLRDHERAGTLIDVSR